MKKKQVNVNNKRVTFYESRDNGKTIVFVHGFSSCSSIFIRQLIDSVLSYNFRIIAVDLLGHGNADFSDNPDKDYTIKGQADFLVDFCNTLDIKDAVFAGHNIGANVIIEALEHLPNAKGLVLLSSLPFSNPFTKDIFKDPEKLDVLFKAGVDDSEVHQMSGWFVENKTSYPEFIPEVIRKADLPTREFFYKSLVSGDYKDQVKILESSNLPVAFYYGELEQIYDFSTAEKLTFKNLWKNTLQKLNDEGHIFFYENPADFNVSLESYLNSVFNLK